MKKHLFRVIASTALLLSGSMLATQAEAFPQKNTYQSGMFSDVSESDWYDTSVKSSYELGFMKGTGGSLFSPSGNMTVAEALTVASRVHDAYQGKNTEFSSSGDNWYDAYVDYAIENGIIEDGAFDEYDRPAKRYEMAVIFANSVPADYLNAQNNVHEIPDVPNTNAYFDELALLYNAGVIMGNDEFGTFKPNNNITRAEAAAIIGRVALPENRLKKELVDANYGDAYYLINDMSCMFSASDYLTSTTSSWFADSRTTGFSNSGSKGIVDFNAEAKAEVWRDIEDVNEGLLGFEFILNTNGAEDGVYVRITDDEQKYLVNVETVEGSYFFNGTDTGVKYAEKPLYVKVRMDLDTRTALLYMDGKQIGETHTLPNVEACRVYIGSDKESEANVSVDRIDLYKDYLVNEIFLDPVDSELLGWETTGNTKITEKGGQVYHDFNSAELSTNSTATRNFNKISGKVVFESLFLAPTAEDTAVISLKSGDITVASFTVNADGIFTADGTKLRHHTNNIWQTLRMEADTTTSKVLYKVNGKKVGEFDFDALAYTVDNVSFACTGGTVFFDDVKVYLTHEYDDYCPTPEPITDDGYDVWMNICSLWHEGSHSGWGMESGYPDIEPVLGYYDEGITEVTDWEIKFWVENGIDVAHFCWYPYTKSIDAPIKRTNLNWDLHDGYFNAKYSDMMKFCLMWENNEVNCSSLDQFKEFIWSYMIDYYFLDDRYYTIDNKVVITVWNYNNFEKAFGSVDLAKKAVEFMNEDLKQYGFDGILIFFADQHQISAGAFDRMAQLGGSGAYAYHWNQDGCDADKTISRLDNNQAHRKIHIVPTVSVGFNNVGWSGTRKPLISLEDHKKVLEHIKNDYLPKEEGWKSKNIIVSTWNEFGEGTYVMPVDGLHGFGYLENVAEVISGVTDHSNNIRPTEQQKARLGHMYPKSKTSLERLDYEKVVADVPTKVMFEAYGSDFVVGQQIDTYDYYDDVFVGSTSKNDCIVLLNDDAKFEPFDAKEVAAIRITMKSDVVSWLELFFTTENSTNASADKAFGATVTASDDFQEYVIFTNTNRLWSGNIKTMRFDLLNCPGNFELQKVEFLGMDDQEKPYSIFANRRDYTQYFAPEERDGELYVAADPNSGFFAVHQFYYEWSRHTGKLYIATANDQEIIFSVGSDKAIVNGEEAQLKEPITLKDGLPLLPLYFLYDSLGITYKVENKVVNATLFKTELDEKNEEIIANRKPYQYEFEVNGDTEGFTGGHIAYAVGNGVFKGTATDKGGNNYDPIVGVNCAPFDSNTFNKITVRMKHYGCPDKNGWIQIFFTTDMSTTADAQKSLTLPLVGKSESDGFVDYVFDCTQNAMWTDKIQSVRIDPINNYGTFEIDSVHFGLDQEKYAAQLKAEEERIARGFEIINGDAEDTENVAFQGQLADVEIVYDEETKSNVYSLTAKTTYPYIVQNVVWEPGFMYTVELDLKMVSTTGGMINFPGGRFHCNARYTDAAGKYDHVVGYKNFGSSGSWEHVKFEFSIPSDVKSRPNDQIAFYTNPVANEGVNFMIDNVTVEKH